MKDAPTGPAPAEATSLVRNSLLLALGRVSVLFTFGLFIFAARSLGDELFGQFTLGLTIASVLYALPDWGTNKYSAIIAARRPGDTEEIVARNLALTLSLAALYLPLTLLGAELISGDPEVVRSALLLAVSRLILNFTSLMRLMFRVHDVYHLDTVSAVVEKLSLAGAGVCALLVSTTPTSLAIGFVLGHLAGALAAGIPFVRRIARVRVQFGLEALWNLFRSGTPIAMRNVLTWVNLRVDMLVLGAMAPAAQLGWYGAVYRLIEGTLMLPAVILGSLGPTLSASHGAGRDEEVRRLYRRGYRYLLIVALLACAAFAVYARPIIVLVFGEEYAPGTVSLQILGFALLFIFVRQLAIEVMDNIDARGATAVVFGAVAAFNTGLNLLLVPRLGHVGAALATFVAEAGLAATLYVILWRKGYSAAPFRAAWRPLLAAVLATATMLVLEAWPIAGGLAGGAVYLLALTLLGTWDGKDRALFRQVADGTRSLVSSRLSG